MGGDPKTLPANDCDAAARRGLARDGYVGVGDNEITRDLNRSSNPKYDNSRPAGCQSSPQTASARIVEVGYLDDPPAAATGCGRAISGGSRKGWQRADDAE